MDSGPILEHMHPPLLVDFLAPANPDSEPRALPPLSTATPPLPIPKKPEDFWECFEHAVDSAIPREFAASKSATEAPNPLLRVVDGLEGLSSEDNIDLALPLHPMQVEEIRAKGRFTHIPKVSMDIIPPKCLRILNHAWRIWIQTQAADLVEAKFEIKKVRVDFECAFFSAQGQIVANFGDESNTTLDHNRFGKLLVILPSFDEFNLNVTNPKSGEVYQEKHDTGTVGDVRLAIWYHGAVPKFQSMGTSLCLLYTLFVSPPHSYEPWQLKIPDDNWSISAMRENLKSWISTARTSYSDRDFGAIEDEILTWVFQDAYNGNPNSLTGDDKVRMEKILKAVDGLGLKIYFADLSRKVTGKAEGWMDPDECDYDDWEELSSPEVDSKGHYIMDSDESPIIKLSNFLDIHSRRQIDMNVTTKIDDEYTLPKEQAYDMGGNGFKEVFDEENGALTQTWRRSALIMWPCEKNAQVASELFMWRGAHLLDPALFSGENVLLERIELAESFLFRQGPFKRPQKKPRIAEFDRCRRIFLEFSITVNREDLFMSTLRRYGIPTDHHLTLIKQAVEKFSNDPSEKGRVISMCIASEPQQKRKIPIVAGIFGADAEEIGDFIRQSFPEGRFGDIYTATELFDLHRLTGDRIFTAEILPKVNSYNKTAYWIQLMNHFEYNDMFREYIPKLVKYHKFSFESALVPEPPRPTYPSYRHGYSQHRTHWRPPNSAHISGNSWRTGYTYHLLHKALYAKDPNSAAEMMEGILNTSLPQIPIAEQDSLIISLTKQIRHDLGSSKIPANAHPGIPRFFQTIILRHLLSKLGPAPPPSIPGPTNLRLPELKCSEKHNCPDCRSVAIFLVSTSDSTRTWSMPKASRAHLMAELKKYSRSKNINVSDNQPRGRVGTLTLKKVGLAHEEKLRDIERKRSKIEGIIYGFIDYLGEGEWRDRILGSVKQGGPGYTTHMRTEAEKFLKEPFPAANDAADHPHPAPANSALPMAIPVRESASLAFLGYGLVYIRDVNLGRRSGPMSPDHVQKLLSSYKAGLRRAEPENSIRVSIKAFDLVRFVSANSSVYKPPTRELKASEPIPAFPGISNYEGHRFLIEAGNHRLLALDEYLTQVRGANGQFLSEDERNQEGWWLAEIYDAAVLATNPDIYALVRSKDPIASDSHLPHPVTPFTSTRTLPLPSEMHPAAPSTPSASPSTASIPTAIRTAPESAITSQVEARPGSPLAGGQKRAINEIDLTSPEGRPPKKKPWKIIDLIELEDD